MNDPENQKDEKKEKDKCPSFYNLLLEDADYAEFLESIGDIDKDE